MFLNSLCKDLELVLWFIDAYSLLTYKLLECLTTLFTVYANTYWGANAEKKNTMLNDMNENFFFLFFLTRELPEK